MYKALKNGIFHGKWFGTNNLELSSPALTVMSRRLLSGSNRKHVDVLIVGGGAMGSSTAYFLKKKEPAVDIVVIERDSTYTQASTTLSVASIRQQFSVPENILLSRWSYDFISNIHEHLKVDGHDPPDIQFQKGAYMFLASDKGRQTLLGNYTVQREMGANVKFMNPTELKEMFPCMYTDDLAAACVGTDNEGWFDGWSLLSSFRKKAISLGVKYVDGNVTKLTCNGKNLISGADVQSNSDPSSQEHISCNHLVNCGGPWAGYLVDCLGVDLPVRPRKRMVFCIDCPKGPRNLPLMVDPSGFYCRPEGRGTLFLSGRSPDEDADEDATDLEVDYDFFYEQIWPLLAQRIPVFEELKIQHSWAGFYEYNTFDQNAILGAHPEIKNLYFANGFSGHGIQQSPAAGNAISELILYGKYVDIDLSRLSFARILTNSLMKEKNVV